MTPALKTKVTKATKIGSRWWVLSLECGHAARRRVKRRWSYDVRTWHMDPAPTWVRCGECGKT